MEYQTYHGYEFYFIIGKTRVTLPITPGELKISSGSNNETVTLINEGEVNLLKSPSLMEVEFEARFPMRKFPYSRDPNPFDEYFNLFTSAKENKQPVRFNVIRTTPKGVATWGTTATTENLDANLYSIEELATNESADEGDDVLVEFKLKKYKTYGIKKLPTEVPATTSTANEIRSEETSPKATADASKSESYTIKSGDCLWAIAKKFYGNGAEWKKIYEANKTVIEETANKNRGGKGSSNGHWIYPNTKLTIPMD